MSGFNNDLLKQTTFVIDGSPSQIYPLALHVRGVSELMTYVGGSFSGQFQTGGTPSVAPNTVVKLEVSNPEATYYLNRGNVPTNYSVALDYYTNVEVAGGATLTLSLIRGDHTLYKEDAGGGIVDAGINGIDGEYVQIDFDNTLEGDVYEERATEGTCRRLLFSGFEENITGGKAEE